MSHQPNFKFYPLGGGGASVSGPISASHVPRHTREFHNKGRHVSYFRASSVLSANDVSSDTNYHALFANPHRVPYQNQFPRVGSGTRILSNHTRHNSTEPLIPTPDWPVAFVRWGQWWDGHVYSYAALFLFLTIVSAAIFLRFRFRVQKFKLVFNTLVLLCCAGVLRSVFLLVDAYGHSTHLSSMMVGIMTQAVYPVICACYGMTQVMLIRMTNISVSPSRVRSLSGLLGCTLTYLFIIVVIETVVSYQRSLKLLLLLDSGCFIGWALYLAVSFICTGFRLTQYATEAKRARKELLAASNQRRSAKTSIVSTHGPPPVSQIPGHFLNNANHSKHVNTQSQIVRNTSTLATSHAHTNNHAPNLAQHLESHAHFETRNLGSPAVPGSDVNDPSDNKNPNKNYEAPENLVGAELPVTDEITASLHSKINTSSCNFNTTALPLQILSSTTATTTTQSSVLASTEVTSALSNVKPISNKPTETPPLSLPIPRLQLNDHVTVAIATDEEDNTTTSTDVEGSDRQKSADSGKVRKRLRKHQLKKKGKVQKSNGLPKGEYVQITPTEENPPKTTFLSMLSQKLRLSKKPEEAKCSYISIIDQTYERQESVKDKKVNDTGLQSMEKLGQGKITSDRIEGDRLGSDMSTVLICSTSKQHTSTDEQSHVAQYDTISEQTYSQTKVLSVDADPNNIKGNNNCVRLTSAVSDALEHKDHSLSKHPDDVDVTTPNRSSSDRKMTEGINYISPAHEHTASYETADDKGQIEVPFDIVNSGHDVVDTASNQVTGRPLNCVSNVLPMHMQTELTCLPSPEMGEDSLKENGYLADTENVASCSLLSRLGSRIKCRRPVRYNRKSKFIPSNELTDGESREDSSSYHSTSSESVQYNGFDDDDVDDVDIDIISASGISLPGSERTRTLAQGSTASLALFRIRQSRMVQQSVKLTYFVTFLFMFACLLQLYTVFGVYGVLGTIPRPDPWPWLIFQSIYRATEFSIGLTLAIIAFIVLNHRHQRAKRQLQRQQQRQQQQQLQQQQQQQLQHTPSSPVQQQYQQHQNLEDAGKEVEDCKV